MAGSKEYPFPIDSPSPFGSDALLAAIVRSSTEAIVAQDLAGTIISWNPAATRIFGYSAGEIVGQPARILIPDDRQAEENSLWARVIAGEQLNSFETVRLTASGRRTPVSVTISPVRGKAGRIVGASRMFRASDKHREADEAAPSSERRAGMLTDKTRRLTLMSHPNSADARTILIVEDEMLIALGLTSMLETAGFEVIGPAGNLSTAMDLLDHHRCALAILDVNLGSGETAEPLAERLKDEGIPFFVTSGYSPDDMAGIFNEAPSFPKPVGARTIVAAVHAALD